MAAIPPAAPAVAAAAAHAAAAPPGAWPTTPMEVALFWIGFQVQDEVTRIIAQLGASLSDLVDYSTDDISALGKSMAGINPTRDRIHFGMLRTAQLKAMVNWAKDFDRRNELPSLDDFGDRQLFLAELRTADKRARIRRDLASGSESRAKEASPGKLKNEKSWNTWEQAFLTQLSILIGVNGVPLSYVVREDVTPDPTTVFSTFVEETVAKARLHGPEFEADTLQVHQLIRSYTIGENAAQWLREIAKFHDGRRDMEALRAHYGEGNNSRQIATAQQLQSTLHYKGKKALEFGIYLDKVKEMFNIFSDCGEPFTEAAKLRYLWDTIESPALIPTIESLKAQLGQNPSAWTFVSAANHLASQIKPVKTGRQLSSVNASDGLPLKKDGSPMELYPSSQIWNTLTSAEKKKIFAARRKAGNPGKSGGRGSGSSRGKKESHPKFKDLTKMVKTQAKQIAALTGKKRSEAVSSDSDTGSVASGGHNAGDSFGGRESKQKKKTSVSFSKKTKST